MCQDLKPRTPRLTIFQKLEIIRHARKIRDEMKAQQGATQTKRKKKNMGMKIRDWVRGVNVQKACETHFASIIGKVKVCQLEKACREQRWEELTEAQQRKMYQLSDTLKASLGQQHKLKGWRAHNAEELISSVRDKGHLQRWTVPAVVLQDMGVQNSN